MRRIRCGLPAWLALFALLVSAPAAAAQAGPPLGFEAAEVEWTFDPADGALVGWELQGIRGEGDGFRDLARPVGGGEARHLVLRGSVAGRDVAEWAAEEEGWRPIEVSGGRGVRLAPEGAGFSIEKRWLPAEEPYRLRFEIRIAAERERIATDPADPLRLGLGPGVGERPLEGLGFAAGMYSFTEAVFAGADGVARERLSSDRPRLERSFEASDASRAPVEWAGLHSRYFALVVAPVDGTEPFAGLSGRIPGDAGANDADGLFRTEVDLLMGGFVVEPGETRVLSYVVYGGPKARGALRAGTPDLGELSFPGLWRWMRALTLGIVWVLSAIHAVVPSWGLSILLLAVLVRIAMHPVAANAMRAQKRFSEVQERIRPELEEIRRKYRGGEQSERILEVYERNEVSPLSGLKPLVLVGIQVPIFIALFHLLGETFELRDASFLWMDTLAEPDRLFPFGVDLPFFGSYFNLLPVLMAVTTLVSIRLSPGASAGESTPTWQTAGLILMTVGFFLLFYPFPSGMVLYWTTANVLHLGHALVGRRP